MNQTRKLLLHYPLEKISEPILTRLVTDYDLTPNLLRADVDAHSGGWMEMDVSGDSDKINSAVTWLQSLGVTLETHR